jgi:hypothetical protein
MRKEQLVWKTPTAAIAMLLAVVTFRSVSIGTYSGSCYQQTLAAGLFPNQRV